MSDQADDSQKTEEPTAKRLRDARQKGQVSMSREVNTWIILFGAGLMVALLLPGMMEDIAITFRGLISRAHEMPTGKNGFGQVMEQVVFEIGLVMLIPYGLFLVLALFAGMSQAGLLFAPKSIEPKLEKISPLKGLKRMFGAKGLVEFAKGMLKILLIGVVGFLLLLPELGRLDTIPSMHVTQMLDEIHALVLRVFAGTLSVLLVIAVADLFFQRMQHIKQLRMTKQEVKEEFKNTEGDPQIKARLRQIRSERTRQRMIQAVPEADVVVTNPTHFAVALKYMPEEMEAPTVVAKGQDLIAKRIRELAEEYEIPVVENAPLARALHATVEVDETVPPDHYEAVAKVISYVFNLKGRRMPA